MKKLYFTWNIKEKPEDFVVEEIAKHQIDNSGEHFLYILEKKNFTTRELANLYNFSYAGLKDKVGITRQYVSFDRFVGDTFEYIRKDRFYRFSFVGRTRKKIKLGRLLGNRFWIKLNLRDIILTDWFINYYDTQRIKNNYQRGKKLIEDIKNKNKTRKKLSWTENFLIDAYLSYLWNKSVELFLKERFKGIYVQEDDVLFFLPLIEYHTVKESVPRYWTILGYKVDLGKTKKYYTQVLKDEGFVLEDFIDLLNRLKIKGDYRKTFIKVDEICIDDRYIQFELPKGSYATMFLKHLYLNTYAKKNKSDKI
ncbi:MAG: tRNA pseudouridine(13) synthase TruD [Aquificae bacterium]|nr:tRNA pseudouridine(13) synthase TruD [Aquificota bacterium]